MEEGRRGGEVGEVLLYPQLLSAALGELCGLCGA